MTEKLPTAVQYNVRLHKDKETAKANETVANKEHAYFLKERETFDEIVYLHRIGSTIRRVHGRPSCFTDIDIDSLPEGAFLPLRELAGRVSGGKVRVLPSASGDPHKCHVLWDNPTDDRKYREATSALTCIVNDCLKELCFQPVEPDSAADHYTQAIFGYPEIPGSTDGATGHLEGSVRLRRMVTARYPEPRPYTPKETRVEDFELPCGFTLTSADLARRLGVDTLYEEGEIRSDIQIPRTREGKWVHRRKGSRHRWGNILAKKVWIRCVALSQWVYPKYGLPPFSGKEVGRIFRELFLKTVELREEYGAMPGSHELSDLERLASAAYALHRHDGVEEWRRLRDSAWGKKLPPKSRYFSRQFTRNRIAEVFGNEPRAMTVFRSRKEMKEWIEETMGIRVDTVIRNMEKMGFTFPFRSYSNAPKSRHIAGYPVAEGRVYIPRNLVTPYIKKRASVLHVRIVRTEEQG